MKSTPSICIDLPLAPQAAFEALVDEISIALQTSGLSMEAHPNGQIKRDGQIVGRVEAWEPSKNVLIRWNSEGGVEIRFESIDGGTRASILSFVSNPLIGDSEAAGWFATEFASPFILSTMPARSEDWITDRRARKPSGPQARAVYREPLYHYPNFKVILAELALKPSDYLLDVGCGGGALLKEALQSGCRAAGIDHSADMTRVASELNATAVAEGRLEIHQASAVHLPFADKTFTCASMTGVFGFLPDPVAALKEIWRVLKSEGRLVLLGSDPALRGTPAAPEPIASRLRFYTDSELRQLAVDAGFNDAKVERREMLAFARQVGVPEEHLPLFAGGAPFLIARKRFA